jgi:hypothetical protein
MTLLSKDQILQSTDREFRDVHVEQWGGSVRISTMTAADRDAFEATMIPEKGKDKAGQLANFRARFVAKCLVDEEGNLVFSPKDVLELGRKSASVLSFLFEQCRELNGMTDKDVEELEKN